MIIIVSSPQDIHARAVSRELDALRAKHTVLDLSHFPRSGSLSVHLRDGERSGRLSLPAADIDLADVTAVWWRRPQPIGLHDEIASGRHSGFAHNEAWEAITGMWHSLRLDALWINDLASDEAAHRKLYQLRVAQDVGLELPETLVTNDPQEAAAFLRRYPSGRSIYKAFSATRTAWRETRLMGEDESSLLDYVRYAPVIFQEYVGAASDVRITAIGKRLFAAEIHSQETEYAVDFRMDMDNARMTPVDVPAMQATKLLALMQRLGLVYGAIDMRRTGDGRWVFLEVNPAGQFLFIEEAAGLPIASALAEKLAAGR